jgi:hypothetical protein
MKYRSTVALLAALGVALVSSSFAQTLPTLPTQPTQPTIETLPTLPDELQYNNSGQALERERDSIPDYREPRSVEPSMEERTYNRGSTTAGQSMGSSAWIAGISKG